MTSRVQGNFYILLSLCTKNEGLIVLRPFSPDEVANGFADGDHGSLQVGHGVAVLALLVQDDQFTHLNR